MSLVPGEDGALIDAGALRQFRNELGGGFGRILGYFRDDGATSVTRIEDAMRNADSAALVLPAHTLKGESRQFGAEKLAALAERIETSARRFVEQRRAPDDLAGEVVALRPIFEATMAALEREVSAVAAPPPPAARGTFGRRTFPTAATFGRG